MDSFKVNIEGKIKYRTDIDVLRFYSIFMVILNHFGLGFTGGFVGVDVFFVISGYIISKLYFNKFEFWKPGIASFWTKRIRRLSPALILTLLISSFASYIFLLPVDYFRFSQSVLGVIGLSSNLVFWKQSGYFDSSANEKPLLHTWSLAVEEQFYLIFPFILFLLVKKRFSLVCFIGLVSFSLSYAGSYFKPIPTYYFVITRSWELLFGVILGCVKESSNKKPVLLLEIVRIVSILLIVGTSICLDSKSIFPGLNALFVVVPTGFLLFFGGCGTNFPLLNFFLYSPVIGFLGKLSYPAYLVHWPFISYYWYFYDDSPALSLKFILIVLTFMVSFLIYLLENQVRKKNIFKRDRTLLVFFFCSMAFLAFIGLFGIKTGGWPDRFDDAKNQLIETGSNKFLWEIAANEYVLTKPGALIHKENRINRIAVWGDSHAMVLIPGLVRDLEGRNIGLISYTRRSTPPILGAIHSEDNGIKKQVFEFTKGILDSIVNDSTISHVVLAGHWSGYPLNNSSNELRSGFIDVCKILKESGKRVVFVRDVPVLHFNPVKSLRRMVVFGQGIARFETLEIGEIEKQREIENDLAEIAKTHGFFVFDPAPLFFDNGLFLTGDNRGAFYCDGHHLSLLGSTIVSPRLVQSLLP